MTSVRSIIHDMRDSLPMFVIYDHPTDFPDHYVARLWLTLPEPKPVGLIVRSPDLAAVREIMEVAGLHKMDREPEDDPAIMETWI